MFISDQPNQASNPSYQANRTARPAAVFSPIVFAVITLLFLCSLASPALAAHEEWNRRWSGPTHRFDFAKKMAVDADGNVYVAGSSDAVGNNDQGDFRLVKYAPDGTELWTHRYDGPRHGTDYLTDLALDADGDAYITGYSQGKDGDYDFATLKYAPNGTLLWLRRYDGPAHSDDEASTVALDAAGNAYVSGDSASTANNQSSDLTTIKYSPSGRQLWIRRSSSNTYNFAYAATLDTDGNLYLVGVSTTSADEGSVYADHHCVTLKYSPAGQRQWVNVFPNQSVGYDLALGPDGSIYVAGEFADRGHFPNSYLTLKLSAKGQPVWYSSHSAQQYNAFAAVLTVDSAGDILVTGNDGTLKYNPAGSVLWSVQNPGGANGYGAAVATDAEKNVYVGGYQIVNSRQYTFALVKYGPDGHAHWSRFFAGPTHGYTAANAMVLDAAENVYIAGYSVDGGGTGSNMRTVKYSQ